MATSIRLALVSAFLALITQQVNSLRARGVISPHVCDAAFELPRASFRSSGVMCSGLLVAIKTIVQFIPKRLQYDHKVM